MEQFFILFLFSFSFIVPWPNKLTGCFPVPTTQNFLNRKTPAVAKTGNGGRRGRSIRRKTVCAPVSVLLFVLGSLSINPLYSSLLQPAQGSTPRLHSGPDQHPAWWLHPLWLQLRLPLGGTQHGHLYSTPPGLPSVERGHSSLSR